MLTFSKLNVVAHPHQPGTYRRIFETIGNAKRGAKFFGDRYATISPIAATREGIFSGRLATWTEVDRSANTIDITSLEEQIFEESGVVIPDGVGLNSRVFDFAFNEKKHTAVVTTRNEEGNTLSASHAKRAFQKILTSIPIEDVEEISVHLITRSDAVERILSLHQLRKIEIDLFLPNPDDLSDDEESIIRELDEMHGKRVRSEITKTPGPQGLVLSKRYSTMAKLAKDNGSVSGEGRDAEGEKIEMSTREYPLEISVQSPEESPGVVARRLAAE